MMYYLAQFMVTIIDLVMLPFITIGVLLLYAHFSLDEWKEGLREPDDNTKD